jgi:hypothetical protein
MAFNIFTTTVASVDGVFFINPLSVLLSSAPRFRVSFA